VKDSNRKRHKQDMSDEKNNIENRITRALGAVAETATDDGLLSPERLSTRKPRVRNPHATRKTALGSLLGLSSLAVVGVLVTTFVSPNKGPLFTLAEGAAGAMSTEMGGDADMRLGWWVEFDYVAGEGLSTEGGTGPVYALELQGSPTERLSALGSYFDVPGMPRQSEYFDPQWPMYVVGAEDWTGPSVNLTWNGTGSWYYNNPEAYPESICIDAPNPEGDPDERYRDCVSPPLPSGSLPSAEQARRDAVAIFAAGGLSVTEDKIRVLSQDQWGVGVSALLQVDGQDTALEWTAYWSPGPILASASGHFSQAVNRGVFDTISPTSAVDRLATGQWWGSPSPSFYNSDLAADGIARESVVAQPSVEPDVELGAPENGESSPGLDPDAPVSSDDPPVEEPLPDPELVDPEILEPGIEEPIIPSEPERITITVTSAEATLLLVWDASGNAWLVPGYVMRHGSEPWDWTTVISLVEGVIQVPEPMPIFISPMPEPYLEEIQ
jgi:hypothetical protein